MSSPDNGQSPSEFSDSDQAWYAALSGEPTKDQDSVAALEGWALRTALEQRRHEVIADPALTAVTSDEALERQLQRLQERTQREGVFDRLPPTESVPPNVIAFPWWRQRRTLVAMAASVLLAAIVVPQLTSSPDYPEPPTMLGGDGIQQLRTVEPRHAAEQLAARLRQANLRPGLFQRGKVYVVDITLMSAELSEADAAFAEIHIKPAIGFNRVEFVGH